MEIIEVRLAHRQDYAWEETAYDAEFVGRWLVHPDPEETRTAQDHDAGAYYGVALTQKGNIAVYRQHVNDGFGPTLDVYESFDEAEKKGEPTDILAMAASELGAAYVRKLDI